MAGIPVPGTNFLSGAVPERGRRLSRRCLSARRSLALLTSASLLASTLLPPAAQAYDARLRAAATPARLLGG